MSLGSSRELAENKLILLYIIDKLNMPLTNTHLTKFVLENKFMNYFLLQQYLNEMCDNNLLACSMTDGKNAYTITESGKQTLEYLLNIIPQGIKNLLDSQLGATKKDIRNETRITADYVPGKENEFIVDCKVDEEDFSLIQLKVTVGTKTDARSICENWKKHSQEIYAELIEIITRNRD